jgi:hypothetical protein
MTLVAVLSTPARVLAAPAWPALPMPPKSDVQWVAQDMRVNGAPTRVLQFQSRASREEVVEYYRAHWTNGYDLPVSIHTHGDATVVGQKHGPYVMTVKIENSDGGKSHGLLSVAQLVGSTFDRSPGQLALMPGARVVSVVESHDPGKHSRQVTILTSQMPASVSRFYESSLGRAGWRQVQAHAIPATRGQGAGRFLVFARDSSEMQLSIVEPRKGAGSTVLANLVTKDTGRDAR